MVNEISFVQNLHGNKIKNNNFDYLLIFFLGLMVSGGIGGPFQPVRIFVILCAPFTFIHFLKYGKVTFRYQYEIFLFVSWISYGIITLFWSNNLVSSIKEILYLILNFFGFLTIIYFSSKASNPQNSILKGWLLLFLLTLPIALYELWFDKHLPISFQEKSMVLRIGSQVISRRFASVTFGNLNGYNTLLCYILPFIIGYSVRSLSKTKTIMIWSIILCLCYIIIMNGSRGAALALLLGLAIFALYYLNRKSILKILLVLSIFLIVFLVNYYDEVFDIITKRFSSLGFHDPGRSSLLKSGWDALVSSGMFGVGAGNFMSTMNVNYHLKITAPHNLFLEVGVQYGLVIFILFLGILFRLYIKQSINPNKSCKYIIIASLAMFPLTSIIDSAYILSIVIWLFLASLHIIADKRYVVNY